MRGCFEHDGSVYLTFEFEGEDGWNLLQYIRPFEKLVTLWCFE